LQKSKKISQVVFVELKCFNKVVAHDQGDQVGRMFAHCAIVFFGQFFYYIGTEGVHIFALLFCTGKSSVLIIDKNGLGNTLGDFFSQSHLVTVLALYPQKCKEAKCFHSEWVRWTSLNSTFGQPCY
jgi:hypothetical protein